ncbi:hypothetical protein ACFQX4_04415 [Roseomonas sp. GCM10028921]
MLPMTDRTAREPDLPSGGLHLREPAAAGGASAAPGTRWILGPLALGPGLLAAHASSAVLAETAGAWAAVSRSPALSQGFAGLRREAEAGGCRIGLMLSGLGMVAVGGTPWIAPREFLFPTPSDTARAALAGWAADRMAAGLLGLQQRALDLGEAEAARLLRDLAEGFLAQSRKIALLSRSAAPAGTAAPGFAGRMAR